MKLYDGLGLLNMGMALFAVLSASAGHPEMWFVASLAYFGAWTIAWMKHHPRP